MSDHAETPSRQRAPSNEMTVSDYRLQEMEHAMRDLTRQFRSFLDRQRDQESATAIAVERCSSHGGRITELEKSTEERIRVLHKRIDQTRSGRPSRLTASAAWTALAAGLGSLINALLHKGGP